MSHGLIVLGALVVVVARLAASPAPAPAPAPATQTDPAAAYLHSNLPELWEVLARHDALEAAHQMARKSVRSPSRRLRFGRRSDPLMPPSGPMQEYSAFGTMEDELMPSRAIRAPVRMRFGRRSLETAVPHILPAPDQMDEDSLLRKEIRAPSMRLRFGRRSDLFMLPYEQAERDYRTNQELADLDGEE